MGLFNNPAIPAQPSKQAQAAEQTKPSVSGSVFGRIAAAQPTEGGIYLNEGTYLVRIEALKMLRTRKGADAFVAEFQILESTSANNLRPAGTTASWFVDLNNDAGPGNVKAFLAALFGANVDEVDAESAMAAVSDAQPGKGRVVHCQVTAITTKAGKPFSKHVWSTCDQQ